MKNYTKMMISTLSGNSCITNVNYFRDFAVTAAYHKKFLCDIRINQTAKHGIRCKENCYSLELILAGEVYLHLDKNPPLYLKAPAVFWIGDHSKEFYFTSLPGKSYEHLWIDFTGERGKRIYESLCAAYPDSCFVPDDLENILPVFEYFAEKFKLARRIMSSPEDAVLIELLLFELTRNTGSNFSPGKKDTGGVKKIAECIRTAPFEKYDVKYLAASAGLSTVHFRAVFRKTMGEPLKQYILKQQMLAAAGLLINSKFRIGELAEYCGFQSVSSFCRSFRKYHGISPKAFQKYRS